MIEPAASYSFNKSHSVCYSLIAYQTAYLKAYYPVEFYTALIRSVEEDIDELSNYIYEAQLQGIVVLPANINHSFNHVAAIDNKIRLWFLWIKGIGREIWESIQQEIKKWLFSVMETNKDYIKNNRVEWYSLWWKSWTSQISYKWVYQNWEGWTNGSFVGLITQKDPKYIVVVRVRRPRISLWWGETAGKVFRDVAKFLVSYSMIEE